MRSTESTGIVADKFFIRLNAKDTLSNILKLPAKFCSKYSELLQESMELKLRNGYIVRVQLDLVKGQMAGLLWFFKDMELSGGELLLFEYFGRLNFNVYIIGCSGSEINYPDRVHCLQCCLPRTVNMVDGGWRFVSNWEFEAGILNEIDPPEMFLAHCAGFLPNRIAYVLGNGKKLVGSYNSQTSRLSGLNQMFDILGIDSLNVVRKFLFTYDGVKTIFINAYDHEGNEVGFEGTPLSMDANGSYPLLSNYFQVIVEAKHMGDDCFAVEISNDHKDLFEQWENFQYINVYSGSCCWRLLIRKRDDYHCATVEDGWKILRDGLQLSVGNICIFECPALSDDQFRIRVVVGDEEI